MMSKAELIRIEKLIDEAILRFSLNLKGLTVLTEAASGYYFVTPIIAVRAGAQVIALGKDSKFGESREVIRESKKLSNYFDVEKKIRFIDKLTPEIIGLADIVTNSGFLRPINQKFISQMKKTAVIPLMYELWELRKSDIDLKMAREKGIIIAGTNEDAPCLEVFNFVKPLILKILFEAGLEIYQNNYLLLSDDKFGKKISEVLKTLGANIFQYKPNLTIDLEKLPSRLDGIIVADYNCVDNIIGDNCKTTLKVISKHFPETKVIQFFEANKMAKTFNDLGPLPVINLHTASLKVGQEVNKARKEGKNDLELRKNKLIQLAYWENIPNKGEND